MHLGMMQGRRFATKSTTPKHASTAANKKGSILPWWITWPFKMALGAVMKARFFHFLRLIAPTLAKVPAFKPVAVAILGVRTPDTYG